MNILLVDDNYTVMAVLKETLSWDALGIQRVFLAESMAQAQAQVKENAIDIVLCDIEMPHGGGLDFLRWLRSENHDAEVAFLTCHANFEYAQGAMRLGCQDYLLKPVEKETIEPVLRRLVRIRKARAGAAASPDTQRIVEEKLWEDLLQRLIEKPEDVAQRIRALGLSLSADARYTMVCVRVKVVDQISQENPETTYRTLKSLAEEMVLPRIAGSRSLLVEGFLVVVFPQDDERTGEINPLFTAYIQHCHKSLGCKIVCYCQPNLRIGQVGAAFETVRRLNENNTFRSIGFMTCAEAERMILEHGDAIVLPDVDQILRLMNSLALDKAYEYLRYWLRTQQANHRVNRKTLCAFQQLITQITARVCANYGIPMDALMDGEAYTELFTQSVYNAKNMIRYLSFSFARLQKEAESGRIRSLCGRMKSYINAHYMDDIAIGDVAGNAGVSQEHAMRVFREDCGMTLGEYLTQVRIENAKLLLLLKEYSISQVGIMTGFNSSAYFTKVFKKQTGLKPMEYRKSCATRDAGV